MSQEMYSDFRLDRAFAFRELERLEEETRQALAEAEDKAATDAGAAEIVAQARERLAVIAKERAIVEELAEHESGQNRVNLLDDLLVLRHHVEIALAASANLTKDHPGLTLPTAPEIGQMLSAASSAVEIESELDRLRQLVTDYQKAVDSAVSRYQAQAKVSAAMSTWVGGFGTRVERSSRVVRQLLLDRSAPADDMAARDRLTRLSERAIELIDDFSVANGDVQLAQPVLQCLDQVVTAEDESAATVSLAELRQAIVAQQEEIAAGEARRKKAQREREKQLAQEERRLVARQVSRVLEDLGYEVSGVSATSFQKDGHLYAVSGEHPDHALRLEFDPRSDGLVARTVRLVASETLGRKNDKEDLSFVKEWCSAEGAGRFREKLKQKGIETSFEQIYASGAVPIDQAVAFRDVEDLRQRATQRRKTGAALRARTVDRS